MGKRVNTLCWMCAFLLSNLLTVNGVPIDVHLTALVVSFFYGEMDG